MPILIISLPSSKDRRAQIAKLFPIRGLEYEIFDAVDGTKELLEMPPFEKVDVKAQKRIRGARLRNSEIAVALSHRRAMRYALQKGWDRVLILEDDMLPSATSFGVIGKIKNLPEFVHIVYLYRELYRSAFVVHNFQDGSVLTHPKWGGVCQGAYAINKAGIERYLEYSSVVSCNMDISTDRILDNRLLSLECRPFSFYATATPSLLESARTSAFLEMKESSFYAKNKFFLFIQKISNKSLRRVPVPGPWQLQEYTWRGHVRRSLMRRLMVPFLQASTKDISAKLKNTVLE